MKVEKSTVIKWVSGLALLCLLLPTGLTAQQRFSAGIAGGFNASQVDGDMLAGFDHVGIHAGLITSMNLNKALHLNFEFLYSERGSRPDVFNPQYDPDIEIQIDYIEIPVYLSIGDWWQEEDEYFKASAHGGFSYGRLMNSSAIDNYNSSESSIENLVPYFNENDFSWLLGVSFRMSKHWGLTARYTRGITPLLDPEKHNLNAPRLTSYWMTIRLEYYFK